MLYSNQIKVRNVLNASGTVALSESILAVAMAYVAPLPLLESVRTDDIFYIHNIMTKVTQVLNDVNEEMVIDISLASDLCKSTWLNRVAAIFDPAVSAPEAVSGWTSEAWGAYSAIKELVCQEFPKAV